MFGANTKIKIGTDGEVEIEARSVDDAKELLRQVAEINRQRLEIHMTQLEIESSREESQGSVNLPSTENT